MDMTTENNIDVAVKAFVSLSKQQNRVGYGEEWLRIQRHLLAIDTFHDFAVGKIVRELHPSL